MLPPRTIKTQRSRNYRFQLDQGVLSPQSLTPTLNNTNVTCTPRVLDFLQRIEVHGSFDFLPKADRISFWRAFKITEARIMVSRLLRPFSNGLSIDTSLPRQFFTAPPPSAPIPIALDDYIVNEDDVSLARRTKRWLDKPPSDVEKKFQ